MTSSEFYALWFGFCAGGVVVAGFMVVIQLFIFREPRV